MYIKKEIRDFIKKIPKEMKLPNHWRKFINENNIEYNLIIKNGKEHYCTNCGKYFYNENEEIYGSSKVCPFCNNSYEIRRSNLKNYFFFYNLALVDNIDNKIILRLFEVRRSYNNKIRKFNDSIVEFGRIIPEYNLELVNDRYYRVMYSEHIYHTKRIKKWRVYGGRYGIATPYKAIYLDNLKEKLKGTLYEYAPLDEAIIYLGKYKVNFVGLLQLAKFPSFELLMKAGLYKLAIECSSKFNRKGNFKQRFGVDKKYYNFMKKYDISYDELTILRIIKKANIRTIRSILKIKDSNIEDLEKISEYVNLVKLKKYSLTQKGFSLYNYIDYINNLIDLNIPLTNKKLFPKNFNEDHDNIVKKMKAVKSKLVKKRIPQRYEELEKNKYSDNIYFIRPAESLEDMKMEAEQQENCVYTNYSEVYAFGKTDIYFMRNVETPNKSLVTVEVKNGKIRQKYQKKNISVTEEQEKFLNIWEKKILNAA